METASLQPVVRLSIVKFPEDIGTLGAYPGVISFPLSALQKEPPRRSKVRCRET
jgi:hypothetical protein